MKSLTFSIIGLFLFIVAPIYSYSQSPNFIIFIADDLGVDASGGYLDGELMPTTPTFDSLRNAGLTFDNAWATPLCTPTRATMMSAKYGNKTGVLSVPGHLDASHASLFKSLKEETDDEYSCGVIGKWHVSDPADPLHPNEHEVDYYAGVIEGLVPDYYDWNKTEFGETTPNENYVTIEFTNDAIDWIDDQTSPWLLWMAHVAPHSPVHSPPDSMYSIPGIEPPFRKYIAMIETLDYEMNRLLNSLTEEEKENTVIIFIGDNGTPNNFLRYYPELHGKASLYQGGIHVPMFISGPGVTRINEREEALIHVNDIHATILNIVGAELEGGIYNSLSFEHLLDGSTGPVKDYNFSEVEGGLASGWTVRDVRYKVIKFYDGTEEFYDLLEDPFEENDLLLTGLTDEEEFVKADLISEGEQIISAWSCRDHIKNGDEIGIDCGGSYCEACDLSIVNSKRQAEVTVFPNPTNGILHIRGGDATQIGQVKLFDLSGRLLLDIDTGQEGIKSIDLSSFNNAAFFVEIQNQNEEVILRDIIFKTN